MTLRQRFNHICAKPLQYAATRVKNRHIQILLAAFYGIVDTFGPFSAGAMLVKPVFDSYTERLREAMKERTRQHGSNREKGNVS